MPTLLGTAALATRRCTASGHLVTVTWPPHEFLTRTPPGIKLGRSGPLAPSGHTRVVTHKAPTLESAPSSGDGSWGPTSTPPPPSQGPAPAPSSASSARRSPVHAAEEQSRCAGLGVPAPHFPEPVCPDQVSTFTRSLGADGTEGARLGCPQGRRTRSEVEVAPDARLGGLGAPHWSRGSVEAATPGVCASTLTLEAGRAPWRGEAPTIQVLGKAQIPRDGAPRGSPSLRPQSVGQGLTGQDGHPSPRRVESPGPQQG